MKSDEYTKADDRLGGRCACLVVKSSAARVNDIAGLRTVGSFCAVADEDSVFGMRGF